MFYHGNEISTEHPDHNMTQHTRTGSRYPLLHACNLRSTHGCDTRRSGGKDGTWNWVFSLDPGNGPGPLPGFVEFSSIWVRLHGNTTGLLGGGWGKKNTRPPGWYVTPTMSPIPNHAKIDVPEAQPSRFGATKARWEAQGAPKGGWEWCCGSHGASVACLPLFRVFVHIFAKGF